MYHNLFTGLVIYFFPCKEPKILDRECNDQKGIQNPVNTCGTWINEPDVDQKQKAAS